MTLASVTFQNYFRLYDVLSGMTGTALTEAEEFDEIYGLGVVEVPTNRPIARIDDHDAVYRTSEEKFNAIVDEIKKSKERGSRPWWAQLRLRSQSICRSFWIRPG